MKEPDVALTDYLIALETTLCAALIAVTDAPASPLRGPFVAFFAATAAAAFAGGTVHGFLDTKQSAAAVALWRATLLALGVAAYAAWVIGARLLLPDQAAQLIEMTAALVALGYAVVVVVIDDRFGIAIAHYLPAAFFLLAAFTLVALREGRHVALVGSGGVALTFAAAAVQHRRIALRAAYFTHNALYHTIQAVGLLLIFLVAKHLV